jgi:hypothetical protein
MGQGGTGLMMGGWQTTRLGLLATTAVTVQLLLLLLLQQQHLLLLLSIAAVLLWQLAPADDGWRSPNIAVT